MKGTDEMITKDSRGAKLIPVLVLVFLFASSEAHAGRYGINKIISTSKTISKCSTFPIDCNYACDDLLSRKCQQDAKGFCFAGDTFISATFGGVSAASSCSITASHSIFCESGTLLYSGSVNCVGSCNALCEENPLPDPDVECADDSDCGPDEICNGGMCEWLEEPSPVMVSLNDSRFELSSWQDGVSFDLDADGVSELTSWTEAGTDDALLVLDRNQNGLVDNGRELFGNYTEQEPSSTPNGFLALALFDNLAQGGDEDGVITASDEVFSKLLLWFDQNHNGVSEVGELLPFSESFFAIDLDYDQQQRIDQHGNMFRYKAKVFRHRGGVSMAYDVFFVTEP